MSELERELRKQVAAAQEIDRAIQTFFIGCDRKGLSEAFKRDMALGMLGILAPFIPATTANPQSTFQLTPEAAPALETLRDLVNWALARPVHEYSAEQRAEIERLTEERHARINADLDEAD